MFQQASRLRHWTSRTLGITVTLAAFVAPGVFAVAPAGADTLEVHPGQSIQAAVDQAARVRQSSSPLASTTRAWYHQGRRHPGRVGGGRISDRAGRPAQRTVRIPGVRRLRGWQA
jgi:hypothetical protein